MDFLWAPQKNLHHFWGNIMMISLVDEGQNMANMCGVCEIWII